MRGTMSFRVASAVLLAACAGCASVTTLADEGRLPEAWREVCERDHDQNGASRDTLLSDEEQRALRERIAEGTRGTIIARAIPSNALHARLGEKIFPREMAILVMHLDVTSHPGRGVMVTPTLVLHGERQVPWELRATWTLAGIEPPVPENFGSYDIAGAFLDAVVAGLTLGAVDMKLRGTDDVLPTINPGRPGTGTPLQEDVLFELMYRQEECSTIHPARLGAPCDAVLVLASGSPEGPSPEPVLVAKTPEIQGQDALVLRVEHLPDRVSDAGCYLGYDIVLPLAEGPDLATRVDALFAKGPVDIGPPAGVTR